MVAVRVALLAVAVVGIGAPAWSQNTFRIDTATVVAGGDSFQAGVRFDTIEPAQGWSLGVCHDSDLIALDGAVAGATALTVNGGGAPDFLQINFDTDLLGSDGVNMGAVISFLGLAVLPAGSDYEILEMNYTGLTFPPMTIDTQVCFCDTLGDPPVATVIVVEGASQVPAQVCATIIVPSSASPSLELVCVSDVDSVDISIQSTSFFIFDYLTLHRDGELIAFIDNPAGESEFVYFDDQDINPGETYVYQVIGVRFEDPGSDAIILQQFCTVTIVSLQLETIEASSGFFFGGDTIEIAGIGFQSGSDLTVEFGGTLGTDVQIIDDSLLTVITPPGDALGLIDVTLQNNIGTAILADAFLYGFARGDLDCTKAVDLGDAVALLEYLFVQGEPPCCADAADANDDGLIDAGDTVAILFHLFDGGPTLPEPFPDVLDIIIDPSEVGLDPTPDGLDCGA